MQNVLLMQNNNTNLPLSPKNMHVTTSICPPICLRTGNFRRWLLNDGHFLTKASNQCSPILGNMIVFSDGTSRRKDRETPLTSWELYCTPCKADGRQETVEGYCRICHEYLCPACISYHRRFRMTKSHQILQGDDIPTESTGEPHIDISCSGACEVHPGSSLNISVKIMTTSCTTINHRTCKVNVILDVA